MPTLKEILNNKDQYGDNLTINIGDTQVPLGSLRELNAAERTELESSLTSVRQKETSLNAKQQEVLSLAQKAQQAYDAAEAARATAAQAQPANNGMAAGAWDDPWMAPVRKAIEDRDKSIGELKKMLEDQHKLLVNTATVWAEDRFDHQYNSLDFGKRDKKPTRDELRQFAMDNRLTDRHGMPSLNRAWDEMSKADREKEQADKDYQRGIEEGKRQNMASRIPPPNVPGSISNVPQGGGAPNGGSSGDVLGNLYTDALADPEIRSLMEQLPAGLM